jgi:hypothetical protein
MANKQNCVLCGLDSDYLPHRSKAEVGVSCKRCGDYYMDDLLVECGEPTKEEGKAILSGFTRWQKELKNPIPEIGVDNIDEIIRQHKSYSDEEKVDKLLLYYSRLYPDKGSSPNYNHDLDYSISYSKNSNEFLYLLKDLAQDTFSYIQLLAAGMFKILPLGWKRIDFLENVEFANRKFEINYKKIIDQLEAAEMQLKEQAGINGTRHSSGLARKIKSSYLKGSLEKLNVKAEIDKKILSGFGYLSEEEEVAYLSRRVSKLGENEKIFLNTKLREIYTECRAEPGFIRRDIGEVLESVDMKVEEILIDIKTAKLKEEMKKKKELPNYSLAELLEKEESSWLEFKSTFQYDIRNQCKNKNLRMEVISTIAAFNNTQGGYLLIGISDDKSIFGLESDYLLFSKPTQDTFLQTLTNVIEDKISKEFAAKIDVAFSNIESKDICIINVNFGDDPVYVLENGEEVFYVRIQNITKSLSGKECGLYIRNEWGK